MPDEGEIGEWNHRNICSPCLPPGGEGVAKRRMRAKSANVPTQGILPKPSHGWWKKNCKQFGTPVPDEGETGERVVHNAALRPCLPLIRLAIKHIPKYVKDLYPRRFAEGGGYRKKRFKEETR